MILTDHGVFSCPFPSISQNLEDFVKYPRHLMKLISEHKNKVWQTLNQMWVFISNVQYHNLHFCEVYWNGSQIADHSICYAVYDEDNNDHEYFIERYQAEKTFMSKASSVGMTSVLNDSPF